MTCVVHKPLFPLIHFCVRQLWKIFFCYLPYAVSSLNSSFILCLMENQYSLHTYMFLVLLFILISLTYTQDY